MNDLLPQASLLAVFGAASFVLALTPGPAVFYIVARSATHGRRIGLASVGGVAAGNWCNAVGASVGLAALFAMSNAAFTVVKLAGAAYLIYLGVQTIRGPAPERQAAGRRAASAGKVFRDGFIVALLNPKTALFFAAFLPQFMTPGANLAAQAVLLGSLFVVIAAVTDSLYAVVAGSASAYLVRSSRLTRMGKYIGGGALVGLGIFAAISGDSARE